MAELAIRSGTKEQPKLVRSKKKRTTRAPGRNGATPGGGGTLKKRGK